MRISGCGCCERMLWVEGAKKGQSVIDGGACVHQDFPAASLAPIPAYVP